MLGAPLNRTEVKPDDELRERIAKWRQGAAFSPHGGLNDHSQNRCAAQSPATLVTTAQAADGAAAENDIYDF
jgi:hypothetical protein